MLLVHVVSCRPIPTKFNISGSNLGSNLMVENDFLSTKKRGPQSGPPFYCSLICVQTSTRSIRLVARESFIVESQIKRPAPLLRQGERLAHFGFGYFFPGDVKGPYATFYRFIVGGEIHPLGEPLLVSTRFSLRCSRELFFAVFVVIFTSNCPFSDPRLDRVAIMMIGEQPGDQEDKQGRPFVGPAGKLLDKCLEEADIDRRKVYVTNTVLFT
jgi:hypothetical protein